MLNTTYTFLLLVNNSPVQLTRGDPPAWGLSEGLTTPHFKKPACFEMLHRASELHLFQVRDQWWDLVIMVMNLQFP
jgi:hypothetical protein